MSVRCLRLNLCRLFVRIHFAFACGEEAIPFRPINEKGKPINSFKSAAAAELSVRRASDQQSNAARAQSSRSSPKRSYISFVTRPSISAVGSAQINTDSAHACSHTDQTSAAAAAGAL
jgi:hypothetical protein